MVKAETFEAKKPIGIGLRPSLWARIDRYAAFLGRPRNQVIEEVLSLNVPVVPDFRKSHDNMRESEESEPTADDLVPD